MREPVRCCLYRLVLLAVILVFAACQPPVPPLPPPAPLVLHMGPPQDRYDHNRTRRIVSPALREGRPTRVIEEVYTPGGHEAFPSARYEPSVAVADGLPAAVLVPVFTGVPLPLSNIANGDGRSDRDDLIDFLAEGPDAQRGIAPGDTMGDIREIAARYQTLLDLLASPQLLQGGASSVQQWASAHDVTWTSHIIDTRYRPSAFAEQLALYCDNFWFVLYRLPAQNLFTRLVVLPVHMTGQDFAGKTPAGKDGRCGGGQ